MVPTERPRLQALLRDQTLPERSSLTRKMKMTPLRIPRNFAYDHELCHSARWQVSEQLSALLGTLLKPLSAFERKAITKKSRPDVDWVYTPSLDNYLPSLLPGVKTVDKDNIFFQVRVLDSMGPVTTLFEHVYGFLAETKPGENVFLQL